MKSVKWLAVGKESSWISSNRLAGYPAKSVPVSGAVHPQLNFSFDLQGLARHERTHLEAFICILCGKPCFSPENLIGKKFRWSLLKAEKFQSSLHKTQQFQSFLFKSQKFQSLFFKLKNFYRLEENLYSCHLIARKFISFQPEFVE